MNVTTLIGRLTKDPEMKEAQNSQLAIVQFVLAVNRIGAKEKTADFIRIVCFGKTAELAGKYLAKGKRVAVQGRIQTGSYKKDGETKYRVDVVAERIEFLEGKREEEENLPEGFEPADDDVPSFEE